MVLVVRDHENAEVNIVLVNNTLRNGRVLKFILVILGIKKSKGILGCYIRSTASKVFNHARLGSDSLGPGRATGYSALTEIISEGHRPCAL